ncbi:MAG: hypothetical protein AAGG08_09450, partial [Actinomycetota bacterium]
MSRLDLQQLGAARRRIHPIHRIHQRNETTMLIKPSQRRRPDAGLTLPELLVSALLTSMLAIVLTTAIMVVVRSTPQAETRLAESKDVTFLNAWLPVDLSTAIDSWTSPDDAAIKSQMATRDHGVTYNASLNGTNVLTLVVPVENSGERIVVSYRYEQDTDGDWRIARYRVDDPGTGSESVQLVGVAYEVPEPPDGWTEGDAPLHAAEVISRNQGAIRPVGEDVTVFFESGNDFTTGGASLSAQQDLTPQDPVTLPDPTAPPTRCGGDIALIIDTSGSVPASSGGAATEAAAVGFIEAFIGTPTRFSLNGFDRQGYAMINDDTFPIGDVQRFSRVESRAEFHSVLDGDDPNVAMMIDR